MANSDLADLADELVAAWGCWAPTLTHDGRRMAFVSDRRGTPELWVEAVDGVQPPSVVEISEDPVLGVRWSPDGTWLACSIATGGGVRSEVWVVRPDGSEGRRVAGAPGHAAMGPWVRRGHRFVVTISDEDEERGNRCILVDAGTGEQELVASGGLVDVLDLSVDERFALLRTGTRGAQFCMLLDRRNFRIHDVLPYPSTGSTESGMLRLPPSGDPAALVAYVVTDAGAARRELVAVPVNVEGERAEAGTLARRDDAELEFADADDEGKRVLLAWNVEGRSELELFDTTDGVRRSVAHLPGSVVNGAIVSRDGRRAIVSVEDPYTPSGLWELMLDTGRWRRLTPHVMGHSQLVAPTLERFESHDGLSITGWLYRPPVAAPGHPAVVSVHGGPEGQERPGFHPQHQLLVAAGIAVLAPNIRGSSGFGRTFVHADDRFGRLDAIADVAVCGEWLTDHGIAEQGRVAVTGRSYGGYAVLMALTHYPALFAAGVDVCGMSDLITFFRDTEPWIARAATTKYGDPEQDAALLIGLSPIHHLDRIRAPVLVVHGELDTNVPINEARRLVSALGALGRDVEYLELEGEGHEYRRAPSRRLLVGAITEFLTRTLSEAGGRAPGPGLSDRLTER